MVPSQSYTRDRSAPIPGARYFWTKSLVVRSKEPRFGYLEVKPASKISPLDFGQPGAGRVFFSSRPALLIGFGCGLLLIMALAGIDAHRVLKHFEALVATPVRVPAKSGAPNVPK